MILAVYDVFGIIERLRTGSDIAENIIAFRSPQ
jgi:hypothetical protein